MPDVAAIVSCMLCEGKRARLEMILSCPVWSGLVLSCVLYCSLLYGAFVINLAVFSDAEEAPCGAEKSSRRKRVTDG